MSDALGVTARRIPRAHAWPGLLAILLLLAPQAAARFRWQATLAAGQCWTVRSPRVVSGSFDPMTGTPRGERPAGFYDTRFHVLSLERAAAGSLATIELKVKENDDFGYDDQMDSYEMRVLLPSWRILSVTWRGLDETGHRFAVERAVPHDPHDRFPFCWPFRGSTFPPDMVLMLPVIHADSTGTEAIVADASADGWPAWRQAVTLTPDGADVWLYDEGCVVEPVTLRFAQGEPWYRVVDATGAVVNDLMP